MLVPAAEVYKVEWSGEGTLDPFSAVSEQLLLSITSAVSKVTSCSAG